MKKVLSLLIVLAFVMMVTFAAVPAAAQNTRVGIVLSTGGLGDLSFNDSAYRGLQRAERELGIDFQYIEPSDPSEDETALRRFANRGFDLIIGVGFQMSDTLETVSYDYPNVKFSHIDQDFGEDIPDNIVSLNFAEWEGSFLAGALAALVSDTNVVGYVGGVDSALIQRFEGGFYQGAKYINPDIEVERRYADSFGDPARGREIALGMIDDGADVIYHAAGGTGSGVFQAAGEEDIYAIGVDSNQNYVEPGHVIASMVKKVDNAVFNIAKAVDEGTYEGGENLYFTLEDGGVMLTSLTEIEQPVLDAHKNGTIDDQDLETIKEMKAEVTSPYAERINEIKEKIINGEIEVENWGITGRPEALE
ncbi:BMP family lipoprotein [Halanaerobium praevalens]|uniref:Basic membrane lipoprotein n=1 Tax=Halanaerobium praevalens (strain ATCC 33744 / DSM 2228 / GSL) TaxID=572479 RepID=E3DS22_HALPG|nr:BMP family ABC transporter substrate-binding protein [Halanaerobium praevalens]ADO77146.1 basic membrane lipoprotein [Halanaerobium praevalens DSM 2228]